jgi:hypothetical protein
MLAALQAAVAPAETEVGRLWKTGWLAVAGEPAAALQAAVALVETELGEG